MYYLNLILFLILRLTPLSLAGPIDSLAVSATPPMEAELGRRRGIAFNNPAFVQYFDVKNTQIGWCYNWYATTTDTHTPRFEYVPMLWGDSPRLTAKWYEGVKHAADEQPDKPTHVLGFNEPDNCE